MITGYNRADLNNGNQKVAKGDNLQIDLTVYLEDCETGIVSE